MADLNCLHVNSGGKEATIKENKKKMYILKEMLKLKVVLQNTLLTATFIGDLVPLETSWMIKITKIHVTLYLYHYQISLNCIQQHVDILYHLFTLLLRKWELHCKSPLCRDTVYK